MLLLSKQTTAQHDASVDEPTPEQIYGVGTLGRILQSQKQENGQIKVVVEGRERATTVRVENDNGAFTALVRRAPVVKEEGPRVEALVQKINQLVEQHLRLAPDAQTDALRGNLEAEKVITLFTVQNLANMVSKRANGG